jgi:hypothetical protein
MAQYRRRVSRAERRRLERQAANRAAREAGATAAEEAEQRPREARSQHQLEILAAAATISTEQARGGARFYLDYLVSGPVTHLRMLNYAPAGRPPKKHRALAPDTLAQEAARLRFERASARLDPLERALAMHVCVCDLPPAAWTPPVGYGCEPPLALLRRALGALVRHYGWGRISRPEPPMRVAVDAAAPLRRPAPHRASRTVRSQPQQAAPAGL